MKKFRFFMDETKEEQWINEMSAQGWHMKKFFICFYIFEKGEPGKYIYRNEMVGNFNFSKKKSEYIELVEEMGAEFVHQTGPWVYFRQEKAKGPFELYTDSSSKLTYLNKIFTLFLSMFLANLLLGLLNFGFTFYEQKAIFNDFTYKLNFTVCILLGIMLVRYYKRRKVLKEKLHIFGN